MSLKYCLAFYETKRSPSLSPTSIELKDSSVVTVGIVLFNFTEEKYYQTDPVDCSLITQELISDFVYEDTAERYLNQKIFRLKRRYQFRFSPKEAERWLYR